MVETLFESEGLFTEAKAKNEFEFILTLINFKGMDTKYDTLYEWFDAIEMYKELYHAIERKKKTRSEILNDCNKRACPWVVHVSNFKRNTFAA